MVSVSHRGPLVHIVLSYPSGRLRGRLAHVVVAAAYADGLIEPMARNNTVTLVLAGLGLAAGSIPASAIAHGLRERDVYERPAMHVHDQVADVADEPAEPGEGHQRPNAALRAPIPGDRTRYEEQRPDEKVRDGERTSQRRVVEGPLDREPERDPDRRRSESQRSPAALRQASAAASASPESWRRG